MLSEKEKKQLIELLHKLDHSQIDYAVQLAAQSKFALTAVETVIFNDLGQVLLFERPDSEKEIKQWRGMPHSPGSMLRETDKSFNDAFARVQKSEIGVEFAGEPLQVIAKVLPTDRGTENAMIHICRLKGEPKAGEWYDPDNLPEGLLSHHREIIRTAVGALRTGGIRFEQIERLEMERDPRKEDSIRDALCLKVLDFLSKNPFVPLKIFAAKQQIAPTNAVEVVTIYEPRDGSEREIHVIQRRTDDPDFPGQWHSSGKTYMNRQLFEHVVQGIARPDETGIPVIPADLIYAGTITMPKKPRSHYFCHVFVRILREKPTNIPAGIFVRVSKLTDYHLVRSHRESIIPLALERLFGDEPKFIEDSSSTDV